MPISRPSSNRDARKDIVMSLNHQHGLSRRDFSSVAAKPAAAFDATWGQFVISPKFFTRLVCQGI